MSKKSWFVNSDGEITDGERVIACPDYTYRDARKDAELLAAAPDLLEVCEAALLILNERGIEFVLRHNLECVIAKARGE